MLIEFSVGNFRSFRERTTFSMVGANLTSQDKSLDTSNLIPVSESLDLVRSAAVYGANASGKSNFVKAIGFMRHWVLNSSRETQANEPIPAEPFRLATGSALEPTTFEAVFFVKKRIYRYGFQVDSREVLAEWLHYVPRKREARLFSRTGSEFKVSDSFMEGRNIADRTRPNALFLSVASQFNGPVAEMIQGWFSRLNVVSGVADVAYRRYTENQLQDAECGHRIVELVRSLDTGIKAIEVEETEEPEFPRGLPSELRAAIMRSSAPFLSVTTVHDTYNENDEIAGSTRLSMSRDESDGTQKLFALSGPLIDTLRNGKTLVVDELDARLHSMIGQAIVKLFNSPQSNPKGAQLVFTTHDTNLLDRRLLRRDQIWFTEKNRNEATRMFSLAEYRGVRNDASFEKDYLLGKYGAVPFLRDLTEIVK